jgi:hypothetical protein
MASEKKKFFGSPEKWIKWMQQIVVFSTKI